MTAGRVFTAELAGGDDQSEDRVFAVVVGGELEQVAADSVLYGHTAPTRG